MTPIVLDSKVPVADQASGHLRSYLIEPAVLMA
jgi:hypothetical protein